MSRGPVIAAAALAAGMAFIDTTALTVALPALQAALDASPAQLLWIHNAYAVPLAALLLPGGALGDRYGVRRTFAAGIALFALASAGCGFAPGTAPLIACRVVQGIGAALMIPGSLALVARSHPDRELGRAVGLWSAFTVVASALGPVLGGVLAQQGLWRGVFLVNLPLAAVALATTFLRVPADTTTAATPVDLPGALSLALALGGLSAALIAPSATAVVLILLGLGSFLARERRAAAPLLPRGLLRSRPLLLAAAVSLLLYAAWGGFSFLLPTHLIRELGLGALQAGLLQLPAVALLAVVSPFAGRALDRWGPRPPLLLGGLLCSAGFIALVPAGSVAAVLPALVLLGLGLGCSAAPLSATILGSVPDRHRGLAAGLNSTVARVATALGVALLGGLAFRTGQGFQVLCLVAGGLALLAAIATLGFTRKDDRSDMEVP